MKKVISVAIFMAACLAAATVFASHVIPVNMNSIVEKSDVAFVGICKESKVGVIYPDKIPQGLLVTTYTFEIPSDGILKGNPAANFQFTQWGASPEDAKKLGLPYPIGIPHYKDGGQYFVFLTAESDIGLRAPVGLGQGKFNVVRGAKNKSMVVNDFGNKGLFVGMPKTKAVVKALSMAGISPEKPSSGEPMELKSFEKMVKGLQKGESK